MSGTRHGAIALSAASTAILARVDAAVVNAASRIALHSALHIALHIASLFASPEFRFEVCFASKRPATAVVCSTNMDGKLKDLRQPLSHR
jgi:hypothetical protein